MVSASQNNKKRKVLVILACSPFVWGGLEAFFTNVLPPLANIFEITLMIPGSIANTTWSKTIEDSGVTILVADVPTRSDLPEGFYKRFGWFRDYALCIKKELENEHYDVIHVNGSWTIFQAEVARVLRSNFHGSVIMHSHARMLKVNPAKGLVHSYLRKMYTKVCNPVPLACSDEAGIWLFGKSYWRKYGTVINNGIDLDRFRYNESKRQEIRDRYQIGDTFLIGNVGRLAPEKNQALLLRAFAELKKENENVKLWLIGDGPDLEMLRQLASELGIDKEVDFLGARNDTADLLQALDVFVFPSKAEGLGIAAIEAECTGLPCVMSSGIPKGAFIDGCPTTMVNLASSPSEWAKAIYSFKDFERRDCSKYVERAGYSIGNTIKQLAAIYSKVD